LKGSVSSSKSKAKSLKLCCVKRKAEARARSDKLMIEALNDVIKDIADEYMPTIQKQ